MDPLYFALAATPAYAICGLWAWRTDRRVQTLAALPLLLHLAALMLSMEHQGSLRIGITEAASLFAWQSALLLWAFSFREPIMVDGVAIYPLAAVFAVWASLMPSPVSNVRLGDWQVSVHVLLSLLSAGLLTLAAVQAAALAIRERLLHRHRVVPAGSRLPPLQTMERVLFQLIAVGFGLLSLLSAGLLTLAAVQAAALAIRERLLHRHRVVPAGSRLPPLQTMERVLFQLIAVGFGLLSLTLLSGLWFVHDWLAQHLAHKTILSITAWWIFGVLLWGRWRHGWRGRTAIRWALAGYATLILAYFGTRIVLEQFLGKHWV